MLVLESECSQPAVHNSSRDFTSDSTCSSSANLKISMPQPAGERKRDKVIRLVRETNGKLRFNLQKVNEKLHLSYNSRARKLLSKHEQVGASSRTLLLFTKYSLYDNQETSTKHAIRISNKATIYASNQSSAESKFSIFCTEDSSLTTIEPYVLSMTEYEKSQNLDVADVHKAVVYEGTLVLDASQYPLKENLDPIPWVAFEKDYCPDLEENAKLCHESSSLYSDKCHQHSGSIQELNKNGHASIICQIDNPYYFFASSETHKAQYSELNRINHTRQYINIIDELNTSNLSFAVSESYQPLKRVC